MQAVLKWLLQFINALYRAGIPVTEPRLSLCMKGEVQRAALPKMESAPEPAPPGVEWLQGPVLAAHSLIDSLIARVGPFS